MDAFWYNALQIEDLGGKQVFKHLASFVFDVFISPHSNASRERVLSKVNLIETKPQDRLIMDTLNGLLHTSECEMLKIHTNKNNTVLSDCVQSLQKERTFNLSCTPKF